jgi:hypothetical protein
MIEATLIHRITGRASFVTIGRKYAVLQLSSGTIFELTTDAAFQLIADVEKSGRFTISKGN